MVLFRSYPCQQTFLQARKAADEIEAFAGAVEALVRRFGLHNFCAGYLHGTIVKRSMMLADICDMTEESDPLESKKAYHDCDDASTFALHLISGLESRPGKQDPHVLSSRKICASARDVGTGIG